jgi:hypothetical protein
LSQDVLVLAKTEKVLDIELEDIGVCSLEVVFHRLLPIADVSQRHFVESPLEQAVCKVLAKILVFDCHRFGVNARSHQETVEDREEGAIVGSLVLQLGRPQFNRENSLGILLPLDSLGELAEQLAHGHLRKVAGLKALNEKTRYRGERAVVDGDGPVSQLHRGNPMESSDVQHLHNQRLVANRRERKTTRDCVLNLKFCLRHQSFGYVTMTQPKPTLN